MQQINVFFHPGDTGVIPPCFDCPCHVMQGDFILKMNTNTVHFRAGICIQGWYLHTYFPNNADGNRPEEYHTAELLTLRRGETL